MPLVALLPVALSLLDVHILPHSHCDVGWRQTVDGYFNASVAQILTTMTHALAADANRTFIWSEVKWLQLWWVAQDEGTRDAFRSIVRSGQLEFVGGGWSQSDEVTPTYGDMLDNLATGHEYLRVLGLQDECPVRGRCVRFGWQIDMFAGLRCAPPSPTLPTPDIP